MSTPAGTVVCCPSASPDVVFPLIDEHGVTVTAAVPSVASLWAEATQWEPADLSSLRLLQVGGSRLSPDSAAEVDARFNGALQQVFGMAEGLLCFTDPDDHDRSRVWATQGRPLSKLDSLAVSNDGGLITSGPYTIKGYYRNPEANQTSFTKDGEYITGDRVRIMEDGSIVVSGRIKDMINSNGENIDCAEVEEMLSELPGIQQIVIVGVPDNFLGEAICAAVFAEPSEKPTREDLRKYVVDCGLAEFKQPNRVAYIPQIPLTAFGKPDRLKALGMISDA